MGSRVLRPREWGRCRGRWGGVSAYAWFMRGDVPGVHGVVVCAGWLAGMLGGEGDGRGDGHVGRWGVGF